MNEIITKALAQYKMPQWKLAELRGVSEFTRCRWMRHELPEEEQERLLKLIESGEGYQDGLKQAKKVIDNDVAGLYGAACIVLHEKFGFGEKMLVQFLESVQATWNEMAVPSVNMVAACAERTGLNLQQVIF